MRGLLASVLFAVLIHLSCAQDPPVSQERPDILPFSYSNFGTRRRLVVHRITLPPEATVVLTNLSSTAVGEKVVRKKRSDGQTGNTIRQAVFVDPQRRVAFVPEYVLTNPDPIRKRAISSEIRLNDPEGLQILMSSANCPAPYPNDEHMTFLVKVAPGYRLTLQILDSVDLERGFDFLFIHDGISASSPLLGVITGDSSDNPVLRYETSGRALCLLFISDASIAGVGFKAFVTPIPSGG